MQCAGFVELAGGKGLHHLRHLLGNDVRRHTDDALSTNGHKRQRQGIITAENLKSRSQRGAQLAHAIGIPTGFLDTDNAGALRCQALDGVHADLDTASAGNAIEHQGELGLPGDLAEMLEQALLCGLVVIGSHLQRAVRTEPFGFLGKVDRFAGRVASGARQDLELTACRLDRDLDDTNVLLVVDGGGFARRAHGHDTVDAAFNLKPDETGQSGFVDGAIAERRDNSGVCSSKHEF